MLEVIIASYTYLDSRTACPACGRSVEEQVKWAMQKFGDDVFGDDGDLDPLSSVTMHLADKSVVGGFCEDACAFQYLATKKPQDFAWLPYGEFVLCNKSDVGCDCGCENGVYECSPSAELPAGLYMSMDGNSSSITDFGASFRTLDCAMRYFMVTMNEADAKALYEKWKRSF